MQDLKQRIEQYNEQYFSELNGRKIIGVTKINEYLSTPFNKEEQAQKSAEKAKYDKNNKYYGMSAEDIIAMWDEKAEVSRMYGMKLDEYAECVYNGDAQKTSLWKLDNNFDYDERLQGLCKGFDEFYAEITAMGFQFIGREIPVYVQHIRPDTVNLVTGRLDAVFYHPGRNKYLIVDWKTTDSIKMHAMRAKKMKGPAFHYEECDMSKYSIQLFIYKHALIDTYNITDERNITVCVINLRREKDEYTGKHFLVCPTNIPYEPQILDDIVDFAIRKRELLKTIDNE